MMPKLPKLPGLPKLGKPVANRPAKIAVKTATMPQEDVPAALTPSQAARVRRKAKAIMQTLAVFIAALLVAPAAQAQQTRPTPAPQAVSKTVHITWVASTTPGVSYNVYKGFGSCANISQFSRITPSAITALSYDDPGVGVGVYCYYATSYLSTAIPNESIPSNKAEIAISDVQPQPPTNIQVTPQSASLVLGQKQQFAADRNPVNWSIAPVIGTIDQDGLYTTPGSMTGNNVSVIVLAKDTAGEGTAQITLRKK